MTNENIKFSFYIIFLLLPLSIVIGQGVATINILILVLFFIFFFIKNYKINLLDHYTIKFFLLLYAYLIFNTIIALDKEITIGRNIGFFRFIVLFVLINYFYNYFYIKKKIFNFWAIFILIIVFDVYVEFIFGHNIFGWGLKYVDGVKQPHGPRIVSFFKDEPVAGAFISGFFLFIFGHLLAKFPRKKIIPLTFLILAFIAIFLTGERSNTIKIFVGIILFFILSDFIDVKKKIISLIIISSIIAGILPNVNFLKNRYVTLIKNFNSKEKLVYQYENNLYLKIYKSGYYVFKQYPFFGVGNKNFRLKACEIAFDKNNPKSKNYMCTTHPHQLYFELLSEHGLIGSLILLSLFFYVIYRVFREILVSRNPVQIGCFIFVLLNFMPILPSGSFFSNFNSTIFWLNFSLMIASNNKTNLFEKNK